MSLENPVKYPVKYYSYLDAGAPQLANIDGNIKTIIKACLVTGIGDKESAGWTALFEDDFRIVLRRPSLFSDYCIKIENGIINGAASHQVIVQDNPTSVDDTTSLVSGNLLARDSKSQNKWYLVVSDFGFLFFYEMSEDQYSSASSENLSVLYCGSVSKATSVSSEIFLSYNLKTSRTGFLSARAGGFLAANTVIKSGGQALSKHVLNLPDVLASDADNLRQRILLSNGSSLPFYAAVRYFGESGGTVLNNVRSMLKVANKTPFTEYDWTFYVPLDYWEL